MTLPANPGLASRIRRARRILLVHTGGLGDTIHQIPALHAIHRTNPDAELHVLVGGGTVSLFKLFPWVTQVHSSSGRMGPRHWRNLVQLRHTLRPLQFDLALSFWPRNTLAALLWLSGARWRVARTPQPHKPARLINMVCQQQLAYPWFETPWCEENCAALALAGVAEAALPMQFGMSVPRDAASRLGLDKAAGGYLHISPFSTANRRDPPLEDLAKLLNGLNRSTDHELVLSSTGDARQKQKLDALLKHLDFSPWKIFSGTLNLADFVALVAGSALHLGPDSGGIHVAMMAERPIIGWFRNGSPSEQRSMRHFAPPAARSQLFVSADPAEDALRGLPIDQILRAAMDMIGS